MARTADLLVRVSGESRSATAALRDVGDGASKFQSGVNTAAKYAAGAGIALAGFGKAAFDAASTAQQAGGAVDAVFGDSAKAIHDFARSSADDVGLSAAAYEGMASTFGAQLKNMGVAAEDLAPTTDDLIGLGADLAAQFGGDTSQAVEALSSLLRGETDPIEKYGVSIKQADIEAKKAAMGLGDLTGEADKQADTQATLALLMEQTADATGAFARESETAAGQQQRANAQYQDTMATLGTALLPVVSTLAGWFAKLGGFVQDNAGFFRAFAGVLAGVTAGILALKVGTMAWNAIQLVAKAATLAWQGAQWLLNAAMTANPIGLVVAGIAALVAGIVVLVRNWDKVTAAFQWFWNWLKRNWPKLVAIITGPFGVAVLLIVKNWRKITSLFRAFGRFVTQIARSVRNALVAAFNYVRGVVSNVIARVRSIIQGITDTIARVVSWLRERLAGAFRYVRDTVSNVVSRIKTIVAGIIDTISRVIGWLRERLVGAFQFVKDRVSAIVTTITDTVQKVIDKVQDVIDVVKNTLGAAFETAKDTAVKALDAFLAPIQWIIDKVNALIGVIGSIKFPSVPDWVPIIGKSAPAPAPAGRLAAPAVRGRGALGAATGGGIAPVVINVQGALDPDSVARQIERLLARRSRRVGGVQRGAGLLQGVP